MIMDEEEIRCEERQEILEQLTRIADALEKLVIPNPLMTCSYCAVKQGEVDHKHPQINKTHPKACDVCGVVHFSDDHPECERVNAELQKMDKWAVQMSKVFRFILDYEPKEGKK